MHDPSIPKHLLIDGDSLLYKAAHEATTEEAWDDHEIILRLDLDQAKQALRAEVLRIMRRLDALTATFCMSDLKRNWRLHILPTYKQNRTGKKPVGYAGLMGYAWDGMTDDGVTGEAIPTFEADDVVGMLATKPNGELVKVIVSEDKDLRNVPGLLYIPRRDELLAIDEIAADRAHMMQTLTGDTTDGYKGLPGVGPIKAEKILADLPPEEWWSAIVQAYEKAGLTADDALTQARVARILRWSDVTFARPNDLRSAQAVPWCPR